METIPGVSQDELRAAHVQGEWDPGTKELMAREAAFLSQRKPPTGHWFPDLEQGSPNQKDPGTLMGLALSGGGIRSATFSLGILQALARKDLLKRFDYLSTVSGGGYIGSALTWFLSPNSRGTLPKESAEGKASGSEGAEAPQFGLGPETFPFGTEDPSLSGQWGKADHDSSLVESNAKEETGEREVEYPRWTHLRFLRQHGNYLTPGGCQNLISALATVLRGLLQSLLFWLWFGVFLFAVFDRLSLLLFELGFRLTKEGLPGALHWIVTPFRNESGSILENAFSWPEFLVFYQLMLVIAGGFILLFAGAALLYSLSTWLRFRRPIYRIRRVVECWSGRVLMAIGIFALIGLIPTVAGLVENWVVETGIGGIFIGAASALFGHFSSGPKKGRGKGFPFASLGAAALIYGLVVLAFLISAWALTVYPGWVWFVIPWLGAYGLLVNLNYVSPHRFYRDRLMEAFLPDRLLTTGRGTPAAIGANRTPLQDYKSAHGPFHLINANLVLVGSKDRTRNLRGGDSFILSPLHCGSNATGWGETGKFHGGKLTLPTAMAISGAAANPHTGSGGKGLTRNRWISLLMTIFNLSLGVWVLHPTKKLIGINFPRWLLSFILRPNHWFPGISSVFTDTFREDQWYLQLSDGGHFDNLGLYELVRRRMRLIVLCDGAADPNFGFADFGVAIRRIEEDFGASIEFDTGNHLEKLMPNRDESKGPSYPPGRTFAERGWIVGTITYCDQSQGVLIYLKTTMVENLGLKTKGYAGSNPDFPDQSTADQFFDEDQFEAYRELGYRLGSDMIDDLLVPAQSSLRGLGQVLDFIEDNGLTPSSP